MTYPARSIIALSYCGGDCGTAGCEAVELTCDCGLTTHMTIEGIPPEGKFEGAFTCDGCSSVTWFTVTREAE
jgi:hypothetical protein